MQVFKELNNMLAEYVKKLEKAKVLPENWFWHKDKIRELDRIDIKLFEDLQEFHNKVRFNPAMFAKIESEIRELHKTLDEMYYPKGQLELKDQIKTRAKIPAMINHLEETIYMMEKRIAEIMKKFSDPIPFDKKVNDRYIELFEFMKQKNNTGELKRWMVDTFNELKPVENIDESIFVGMNVVTESSLHKNIIKRYGHPYFRPIFSLNIGQWQRLCKALHGSVFGAGANITNFKNPLLKGLNIIIGQGDYIVRHELRHSIDVYADLREGRNWIITEIIAFFDEVLEDRVIKQTSTVKGKTTVQYNKIRATIDYLRHSLKEEKHYYECAAWGADKAMSMQEYKDFIDKIFDKLVELNKTHSKEEIDRFLFHCKTVEEIMKAF